MAWRSGFRHRRRGFTLVEVMVALVIMSVLAVMAWQGVDGIVRARDASTVKLDQTLRLSTVLMQWDQDLAAVQTTTALPRSFAFDGGSLRIVRRAERGLQVVVWSLRPGLDGTLPGKTLQRWVGPPVATVSELTEQWFRSQQLQGAEPEQVRAVQGLGEWQLYCFIGTAWANCQSSDDSAAPPAAPSSAPRNPVQPPDGVRLVLSFAEGSGNSGRLTRDTRLAAQWPGR